LCYYEKRVSSLGDSSWEVEMRENVIYQKKGKVGIIKLNRPEVLNAVNDALIEDFLSALELAREDETRVIILKGEGRAFCAGVDLKESAQPRSMESYFRHVQRTQEITRRIANLGKPVIAAVQGYAVGEGFEYAMDCDIRIAAEGTKFFSTETSLGGTVTNAACQNLPRLIGMGRAKELIYTNRRLDAKEAEAWGLVNKVVPRDQLDEAAMQMAEDIASRSVLELKLARFTMDAATESSLEVLLRLEALAGATSHGGGERRRKMAARKEEISRKKC